MTSSAATSGPSAAVPSSPRRLHRPVGLLLAQMGTPAAPTVPAVRRYLRQFLGDPRIIEGNRFRNWLILNGIILVTRPRRSAAHYRRIWGRDGSPLLVHSRRQRDAVAARYDERDVVVELGMRYGEPSLGAAVRALLGRGCREIVLLPMYPQYSATTSGSTYGAVFEALLAERWVPAVRVVAPYFEHPAYLNACAAVIDDGLGSLPFEPERLVLSYHGIPAAYVRRGDPYPEMCEATTGGLRERIGIAPDRVLHTFQSRFGREPWLEPYTDETLVRLAKEGIRRVAIACPGFTADCLETLDELGIDGRARFTGSGGVDCALLPALNDHPAWIEAITDIVAPLLPRPS